MNMLCMNTSPYSELENIGLARPWNRKGLYSEAPRAENQVNWNVSTRFVTKILLVRSLKKKYIRAVIALDSGTRLPEF